MSPPDTVHPKGYRSVDIVQIRWVPLLDVRGGSEYCVLCGSQIDQGSSRTHQQPLPLIVLSVPSYGHCWISWLDWHIVVGDPGTRGMQGLVRAAWFICSSKVVLQIAYFVLLVHQDCDAWTWKCDRQTRLDLWGYMCVPTIRFLWTIRYGMICHLTSYKLLPDNKNMKWISFLSRCPSAWE